jgi:AbrB family looped-hinge helix DNA binding protein
MRITSKGQVTIPQAFRRKFGLLPETEVEFVAAGDGVKLRKTKNGSKSRGDMIVEHMRGRGTIKMSTDEIMALTRG